MKEYKNDALATYWGKMNIINDQFSMHDLLRFCLGDFLMSGEYRTVFDWNLKPNTVVKYCHTEDCQSNWTEYSIWESVKGTKNEKWFCPIIGISPCGRFLLMKKTKAIKLTDKLPKKLPNFFSDIHIGNFGWIGKQLVCIDYQFIERALDLSFNKIKYTLINMLIGYTSGVYDLFHIGHLNLFKNAKGMCDKLIVGVTTDELALYKNKVPIIPYSERIEIVRSIRYVDAVVAQENMDKLTMCKKLKANIMFVGDDWYDTDKWNAYEIEFQKAGIKIVYFPYTKETSSTLLGKKLSDSL